MKPNGKPTWKVEKKSGPDMGSYNVIEAVMKVTKKSSPGWGMGNSKRVFFTEEAIKSKKSFPSVGAYDTNDSKIHKRLQAKRH